MGTPPVIESLQECWFLTGPTAAGKTQVGLSLAERLDAEIISIDSMSIYRGMDIGTAKPSLEDQARVPHHLIDILDPSEEYSLSQYVEEAETKVREIRERGRQVLFVGGTPLYLKALLRGIFEGPPADWDFRREVEEEAHRVGTDVLHERLRQVDPLSADELHPNDLRRIIRALEVYKITGSPISHQQLQFDEGRFANELRAFQLDWPRFELHARIQQRVEQMFERGLVDEVRQLLDRFGSLSRTASQAVGYREIGAHLRDEINLSETMQQTTAHTRQFAKRQLTWFRSLSELRVLERSHPPDNEALAEKIAKMGS